MDINIESTIFFGQNLGICNYSAECYTFPWTAVGMGCHARGWSRGRSVSISWFLYID